MDVPLLGQRQAGITRTYSACVLAEGATTTEMRHSHRKNFRKLALALALASVFMVIEIAGGIYAHSLAIITDAAHLLSDVSGFAVSLLVAFYVSQASAQTFSYGYHRMEVLGALASVLSVWAVTGVLLWEAALRLKHPQPVNGKVMTVLALVGVAVNLLLMAIIGGHHHPHGSTSHSHSHSHSHSQSDDKLPARSLSTVEEGVAEDEEHAGPAAPRGSAVNGSHAPLLEQGGEGQEPGMRHTHAHAHNLGTDPGSDPPAARESRSTHSSSMNMHGAFIHAVGDLLQSLGVAAAGGLIWWHQDDARWAVADPLCTFFFAAIVLWTTLAILRDIGDVLMERTPRGICVATVGEDLRKMEGVGGVEDLHVWSLTPGIPLLCAHVMVLPGFEAAEVLHAVTAYCRALGIEHSTIQLMTEGIGRRQQL